MSFWFSSVSSYNGIYCCRCQYGNGFYFFLLVRKETQNIVYIVCLRAPIFNVSQIRFVVFKNNDTIQYEHNIYLLILMKCVMSTTFLFPPSSIPKRSYSPHHPIAPPPNAASPYTIHKTKFFFVRSPAHLLPARPSLQIINNNNNKN